MFFTIYLSTQSAYAQTFTAEGPEIIYSGTSATCTEVESNPKQAAHAVGVFPTPTLTASTLASGTWNTSNVWSCSTVPTALDDVRINTEHTIALPDGYAAKARSVDLRGQIQYNANAALQVGED